MSPNDLVQKSSDDGGPASRTRMQVTASPKNDVSCSPSPQQQQQLKNGSLKKCARARGRLNATGSPTTQLQDRDNANMEVLPREKLLKLLVDGFPGRKREIEELLCILGGPCDFFPPLLVYGGPATGKTSVVQEIFKHLGRPYTYVSCRSCHNSRIMFESIINRLVGHVRTADNNYSSAKKCERPSDFVELLPDACEQAVHRMSSKRGDKVSCTPGVPRDDDSHQVKMFGNLDWFKAKTEVVYLIIDNVDLIRSWGGGSNLLSVLFKLPELTRLPQLGIILISSVGPHAYMSGTGCREPLPVYFRDYLDEELFQILVIKQRNPGLYSSFLNAVLKPFSRATRRVTELSELLEPLFDKYCEPIISGTVYPDEQGKRKLFTLIKPYVRSFLGHASTIPMGSPGLQRKLVGAASSNDQGSELHLPLCSKYLLLAAYIASSNPATLDAALFEAGGGNEGRKRRRKSSLSTMEKKDKEMQERQLKGPGSFSLERLLAIFSCIATGPGFSLTSDNQNFQHLNDGETIEVTADVLMQLSTLVGVNLISQGLTDPLEGSPKYRCNVDEDLIHKVAKSVNFPLNKYLYYNC